MRKLIYPFAVACLLATSSASAQTWTPIDMKTKKDVTDYHVIGANGDAAYAAAKYHGRQSYALFKVDGSSLKEVWEPEYKQPQSDIHLDVDPKGIPYFACKEGDFFLIKRLEGNKMVDVSTEVLSSKGTNYFTMMLDKEGTPYVSYSLNSNLYIKKLNGGKWEQLLETPQLGKLSFAFDNQNVLHLTSKNIKLVKKLEKGALVDVGSAYTKAMEDNYNLFFDKKGALYVTFCPRKNYPEKSGVPEVGTLVDVKQPDGKVVKEWKFLPRPTDGTEYKDVAGELVNLAWDNNNTLYFACSFRSPSGNTVQKFDGTKWVPADNGIDGDNKKVYDGIKKMVFGAKSNMLFMNRPLMSAKL